MSRVRLVTFLFPLLLTVLLSAVTQAQVTQINDTTSTPIEGAGHNYIKLLSETVNPANGSVSINIPLPMPKGRGLTVPFAFDYNSNGLWHIIPGGPSNPGAAGWFSNQGSFASGGWSYVYPSLSLDNWTSHNYILTGENNGSPIFTDYPCYETSNYLFSDGTGGIHSLGLGTQSVNTPPPGGCPDTPGSSGASGDAQVYGTLLPNGAGDFQLVPITVYDKAGTVYSFPALPGGGFSNTTTNSGLPVY